MMTPNRKRDWLVLFLPTILSPFFLTGILWLAQPRLEEAIRGAIDRPEGQVVACGMEECAEVPTLLSALTARVSVLEALAPPATDEEAGPCSTRATRTEVDSGPPGGWVELRIFGVCRLRSGCGAPVLNPALVNGGGRFHSMESGFNGIALAPGECRDFAFPVRIPEASHSGLGQVLLNITYPFARPAAEGQTHSPARLIIEEAPHAAE